MATTVSNTLAPKKRITSIDALRGFALLGIILWHSMEHWDLMTIPEIASPFWQAVDTAVYDTLYFLISGKSYAIFSLLFGLSFFMQMDSQAARGKDFRGRFFWRLVLLFILGYINGTVYMGELFVVYAVLGMLLIPLWKVPSRWLLVLAGLFFLQIPGFVAFFQLLGNNVPNEPSALQAWQDSLYAMNIGIFSEGSLGDVLRFNLWDGQIAKWLWMINNYRYLQLFGLFILGLVIGRTGVHKDEERMVRYSRKVLPWAAAWFGFFYAIVLLLPQLGLEGYALSVGQELFRNFANMGQMFVYITALLLLYYRRAAWRKALDAIAPMGRMSATNYMVQSFVGIALFYGFGLDLAARTTLLESALVGVAIGTVQVLFSRWWIARYYYGPVEWIWRTATWMQRVPLRRK